MLNKIKNLSYYMNVSGCETSLINAISTELKGKNITSHTDNQGNLLVFIDGTTNTQDNILITASVDVPGFMLLSREKKISYLLPTKADFMKNVAVTDVLDVENHSITIKTEDKKDGYRYFHSENYPIGSVFRLPCDFSEKDGRIYGLFSSLYALIALLSELCSIKPKSNTIICFTVNGQGYAHNVTNVIAKYQPNKVILLGCMDNTTNEPVLLVKDGKAFSNQKMIEEFLARSCTVFKKQVTQNPITKAEELRKNGYLSSISLALPCSQIGTKTESFSKENYSKLLHCVSSFLS